MLAYSPPLKDSHMRRFVLVLVAGLALASSSAFAARRCDGNFELVRGSWVSTRYCRANEIASVARSLGFRVSTEAILTNPAKADEVCRWIGSDIRAQPACEQVHSIFQLTF
jgi:hypothetical protein